MEERILTEKQLERYRLFLYEEEKSRATIDKYMRDIRRFYEFSKGSLLTKGMVLEFKQDLVEKGFKARSINSMLASVNGFLRFMNRPNLCVKYIRIQQDMFYPEEKQLTRDEYERLCRTAEKEGDMLLSLIIQTICSTGIRVSELSYITVDSVKRGEARVSLKGKTRVVFLPNSLRTKLERYAQRNGIQTGMLFQSRTGKAFCRSTIWRKMKKVSSKARVRSSKVFPHNLRHLFAREFYGIKKDMMKLADILGHSSIDTTRIYIKSTGREHREQLERMRLVT